MSMEREKLVKLVVAGVIGVAAVVVLALNLVGNGAPRGKTTVDDGSQPREATRGDRVTAPRPEKG